MCVWGKSLLTPKSIESARTENTHKKRYIYKILFCVKSVFKTIRTGHLPLDVFLVLGRPVRLRITGLGAGLALAAGLLPLTGVVRILRCFFFIGGEMRWVSVMRAACILIYFGGGRVRKKLTQRRTMGGGGIQ